MNNLYNNGGFFWWLGVVEDRNDPLFLGRCKIRIAGYHNANKIELPIEDLPWATPMQSISSAAMSGIGSTPLGPVEGTWVVGFFLDGDDCQQPVFMGTLAGIPQPDIPGTIETNPTKTTPSNALKTPNGNVITNATTGEPVVLNDTEETQLTGVVGPLTNDDLDKLFYELKQRESSGNYKVVNRYGYLGAYQFGADLLCGLGFIKNSARDIWSLLPAKDDYAATALERGIITDTLYNTVSEKSRSHLNFYCISNDYVWTTKGGGSAEGFLASKDIQDQAILAAFKANYRDLVRRGVLNNSDTKGKVAGFLFAAHLVGIGGAMKLASGIDTGDANNTKASTYYNIGYKLVDQSAPNDPSQESKDKLPVAPTDNSNTVATQPTNEQYLQTPIDRGFVDPNRVYPRVDYISEPDTNRLARHHKLTDTIVGKKDVARIQGVEVGITGETWDQPPVPYNAKYPYNHVKETESGHVIEIDDTPGNERIHIYHRAGTWIEIDRNGTCIRKVVGDDYTILERNGNVLIQGRANITIDGSCNVYVKNNCNLQVDGDLKTEVHGDYKLNVAGDIEMVSGGDLKVKTEGSLKAETKDELSIKGKDIKIQGTGKVSVKAGTIMALQSSAAMGVTAGAVLSLKGLSLALMSAGPTADSANTPSTDSPVDSSSPSEPTFPELIIPSRTEEFAFNLDVLTENFEENGEDIEALLQQAIADGLITQEELDQEAIVTETDTTNTPEKKLVVPGCGDVYNYTDFPVSYRLSTNFTLAQLSTAALVSSYKVVPQHGLTKQDIVCNLKSVAEQILEPIYAQYPNMVVTSGFRSPGNTNSQHQRGQAVDLQFRGVSKTGYFAIAKWIKQNINYDEMLLEYKSYGSKMPWIHLSFNRDGCRNICHTFFNDKVAPNGRGVLLGLA